MIKRARSGLKLGCWLFVLRHHEGASVKNLALALRQISLGLVLCNTPSFTITPRETLSYILHGYTPLSFL
jgi:hypothetical protein